MAKNQSRRLPPRKLSADENAFASLQAIAVYTPINSVYELNAVRAAHDELQRLRKVEAEAAASAASARDEAVAKEWEFHNLMLGVKEQVIAQYGRDSLEVKSLGLKRKSEYKPPVRKAKQARGAQ